MSGMNDKGTRLLAAIMFTDMVGYTALMQEDEKKAKLNRDRHRKILQDSIAAHKGKILQYYGDGTLCIFNSAIEAIDCAIQIQTEMQKEPKIPLRIGLHTGDIAYDDEGVYGDGVNIASRIEGLAVTGSVLISGKLFDEIKNHQAFKTKSLGSFDLKNVKKPIEVYAISNEGLAVPSGEELQAKPKEQVKSLAVLPFVNMSPDPENEYFSDGVTEELLNVLARMGGLHVIARTSSFAFKGRHEDIRQIGAQLGANTILEGSVRKAGNRVRITAQLINTADGYHLWSETYDRQLDDIFEVQDEIALKISNRLREKLTLDPEKDKLIKVPTENIEAYNVYLKGLYYANKWTLEDAETAKSLFQDALEMQPDFALPYTGLSSIYVYLGASGKLPPAEVFPRAKAYARKAIQLDERSAESHCALATVNFYYDWDWKKSLDSLEKALELNPSFAGAYLMKAMIYNIHGKSGQAIEIMQKSINLDPLNPPGYFAFAAILSGGGQYEDALIQYEKLAELNPNFPDILCNRGYVYLSLGKYETAKENFDAALKVPGSKAFAYASLAMWHMAMNQVEKSREFLQILLDGQKSFPGQPLMVAIALVYAALDKPDDMFHYLNRAIETREHFVLFIHGFHEIVKYHADPRFEELLSRMGLNIL
jgi:TolB-like protein/Tfp pilus assembly protein PilF